MASRRSEKMSALLRETIAGLIIRGIKDPRVSGVTITGVDVSPDLRHADVYYRVLGAAADAHRAQAGLQHATGYIQGVVGRELRLRYTPELRFEFDPTPDRARRLEELLAAAKDEVSDEPEDPESADGWCSTRR
jgi:ribosome-binding factor A